MLMNVTRSAAHYALTCPAFELMSNLIQIFSSTYDTNSKMSSYLLAHRNIKSLKNTSNKKEVIRLWFIVKFSKVFLIIPDPLL